MPTNLIKHNILQEKDSNRKVSLNYDLDDISNYSEEFDILSSNFDKIRNCTIKYNEDELLCHDDGSDITSNDFDPKWFSNVNASEDIEKTETPKIKKPKSTLDKNMQNEKIHEYVNYIVDNKKVFCFAKQLYSYNGKYYEPLDEHDFSVMLLEALPDYQSSISCGNIIDIYKKIKVLPKLQRKSLEEYDGIKINFNDGTYDIAKRMLMSHDDSDTFLNCIDVNLKEYCDGFYFENFINVASDGDPNVRAQILEIIGILLAGIQIKAFFVIVGPSGTGKSQLGKLLSLIVGEEYTKSIKNLNEIGSRFGASGFENKKLILCMDLANENINPTAVGRINQLVGIDIFNAENKGVDSKNLTKKPVLVCASNYALKVGKTEEAKGVIERMRLIPFIGKPTEIVHDLYKKLADERSYIINEALHALSDLIDRNYELTVSEIPEEYDISDVKADNIVNDFVMEHIEYKKDSRVATSSAYDMFNGIYGPKANLSTFEFGRLFKEALTDNNIDAQPVKRVDGKEQRGYKNIKIKGVDGNE